MNDCSLPHRVSFTGGRIVVQPGAVVGMVARDDAPPARFVGPATIRSGSVIYADVEAGEYFQTGHNVVIRPATRIGRHVTIGTNTVIEGEVEISDFVKLESNCFVPTHVRIGSRVFFGPAVVLANDRYPLRQRASYRPEGPIIEDDVTIGAGAIILPGVTVGAGSFIAAGAVVTADVPPSSLVVGAPGRASPLPEALREPNCALSWRSYLDAEKPA